MTSDPTSGTPKASVRAAYLWDALFFIMLADTPAWPKREGSRVNENRIKHQFRRKEQCTHENCHMRHDTRQLEKPHVWDSLLSTDLPERRHGASGKISDRDNSLSSQTGHKRANQTHVDKNLKKQLTILATAKLSRGHSDVSHVPSSSYLPPLAVPQQAEHLLQLMTPQ